MRFGTVFAALCAACASAPAQAQATHIYVIDVFGWVSGFQNVYTPDGPFCNGGGPGSIYCNDIGPFSAPIGARITMFGTTPAGQFSFGYVHGSGEISGTIVGDVVYGLSGVNLTYDYSLLQTPYVKYGTAPTFFATLISIDGQAAPAPVPEPATWGLLILGFGGIGAALRRRQAKVSFV